ncbi:CCA tRNA nucleotidyltransferase [Pseudooceanicola sediminis]|uniref:CCA tRNA nucleotidyltransferase n=1 Tax=Pseudooceanicola sediminis TaxID=2211117 RepID=A0A399J4K3_9RHOB|nr:CCA tRNA nucleotidyltransferase [Pseudooceanicola sediminis]KAA2315426.1 CCA tRNA nucleotidyltransferase [Puniceibacterium sp. HSS470]RII40368.1 CCA tRNA nucleotidyltransferase [Pseudooceanicola sediminis]|tara:strand:+ start:63852 stop:65009 length:1158 start_codon:yes stop_codon:yes gene_type:complete
MAVVAGDWLSRDATQAVCRMLTDAGYLAYFVGGCVRDALLGLPVGDVDICTDARPATIQDLAGKAGLKAIPTGIDHGTITVVSDGIPHEVTTFRRDVETDGRRAVVAFSSSIEEDARRRDFTMNALYADPQGQVLDPLGGMADLKARRLRFIEDADLRIREDYLRILRFFRFHARFGDPEAGLDPEALNAIASNAEGLETLSAERVGSEMTRLLGGADPAPAMAAMQQTGALVHVLPGANPAPLAPLIHVERLVGLAPDWGARLAALGGEDTAERLRLSRKDTARLMLFREEVGSARGPGALGYLYGATEAAHILTLRVVLLEQPFDAQLFQEAREGATATFPLSARDLMPAYEGAALGQRLAVLKDRWIGSGFTLDRAALLREE